MTARRLSHDSPQPPASVWLMELRSFGRQTDIETLQFPPTLTLTPKERVPSRLSLEMDERRDRRMCRLALQSHLLVKSDPPML